MKEVNGHSVFVERPGNAVERLRCEECDMIGERPSRFQMTECREDMDRDTWLHGPVARISTASADSISD